jgi:hypothetical protein
MSFVNFGMSFVLKGLQNPKLAKQLAKRALLDGVFQIHIDNRQFVWLVKTDVIHTVSFSDLYDARGSTENKYILEMLFNGSFPCELHAQSEAEREIVHRILQCVIQKTTPTFEDKLLDVCSSPFSLIFIFMKFDYCRKELVDLFSELQCIYIFRNRCTNKQQ